MLKVVKAQTNTLEALQRCSATVLGKLFHKLKSMPYYIYIYI